MMKILSALYAHKSARFGLILLVILAFLGSFAPFIAPHGPTLIFTGDFKLPPAFLSSNWKFILGTDDVGRDLLSRLIFGTRISLFIGLTVVALSAFFGTFLGLLSGLFGGILDKIIMQLVNLLMSLPSILLAIVIVSVLGTGLFNTIIAVSIVGIPNFVRLIRACVLVEKEKQYVKAAQSFGAGPFYIMFREILPNCLTPLMVQMALGVSDAILSAAALGFLGLGAQAPTPEWGVMLADGRHFLESDPHLVILPGLFILITVLALNLLGDGLRDILDPKLSQKYQS